MGAFGRFGESYRRFRDTLDKDRMKRVETSLVKRRTSGVKYKSPVTDKTFAQFG